MRVPAGSLSHQHATVAGAGDPDSESDSAGIHCMLLARPGPGAVALRACPSRRMQVPRPSRPQRVQRAGVGPTARERETGLFLSPARSPQPSIRARLCPPSRLHACLRVPPLRLRQCLRVPPLLAIFSSAPNPPLFPQLAPTKPPQPGNFPSSPFPTPPTQPSTHPHPHPSSLFSRACFRLVQMRCDRSYTGTASSNRSAPGKRS